MWQYNCDYLQHGLFSGWTKKAHKYIDKYKSKLGNWVYVYKDKANKVVKSMPKKIETGLNNAYKKAVEFSTNLIKNNPWVIDSGNYDDKIKKVKETKEWKDIISKKDPEYVHKNGNGTYTYDIDAYITNKKHPILDIVDDVVNGRDITLNNISVETIIAGADDYIQAGMAYVALASMATREGIKYRQGSYKEQEADIQRAITNGVKMVNKIADEYDKNQDSINDILDLYYGTTQNAEKAKKYANIIQNKAQESGVAVDDILDNKNIQEYLSKNGITEYMIKKYL